MEDDDGELEDIDASYIRECLAEWLPMIQFFDDWEAGLFTVSLSEIQYMPCTTLVYRRIHKNWLNEARRRK